MFNWQDFLEKYNVPYVEYGSNVAKGNVNIRCPFCGSSDPSEHLGLNLATGAWGCWRDTTHRGRKPHRLVQALLGCSYVEAAQIVGYSSKTNISNMETMLESLKGNNKDMLKSPLKIKLLNDFKLINDNGFGQRFTNYLIKRKFKKEDIWEVCGDYNLHYCLTGNWKNRIVIPVYFDNELATWTARSIHPQEKIRYKTLSYREENAKDRGDPTAPKNIKELIYNYDDLLIEKNKVLIITEGPFDAIKMDYYGKNYGVRATCLFGLGVNDSQMSALTDIAQNFDLIVTMLDEGADLELIKTKQKLSHLNTTTWKLPPSVEDPGDLSQTQIKNLIKSKL